MTDETHPEYRRTDPCPAIENPLSTLIRLLQSQLAICDALEDVADSLPNRIDRQQCEWLAGAMTEVFRPVHDVEEKVVFPRLQSHVGAGSLSAETCSRLCAEHRIDQDFSEEVQDLLSQLASDDYALEMDTAGYMLRGFFHSVRRHVHFELDHVLPLAFVHLDQADLDAAAQLIADQRMILPEPCVQTRLAVKNRTP